MWIQLELDDPVPGARTEGLLSERRKQVDSLAFIGTIRMVVRVVFDTSVLVAAARSRFGASYALVNLIPAHEFQLCLSVALYTEWQEVLTRPEHLPPGQTAEDAGRFLRYLASESHLQEIYFLWRPFLRDADDDLVLELAFAANCRYVVTHNVQDFDGSEQLGITALAPRDFWP